MRVVEETLEAGVATGSAQPDTAERQAWIRGLETKDVDTGPATEHLGCEPRREFLVARDDVGRQRAWP